MTYNIILDPITSNPYYYITDSEQLKLFQGQINPNNFLVGLYDNQTRFLTNNGTLVKFASNDISQTYNLLNITNLPNPNNAIIFDLANGHAFINFKCASCDEGNERQEKYDFFNKVSISSWGSAIIPLEFQLTDLQAIEAFKTLTHFSQDASYKYIPNARDCVAFLKDISLAAGLGNFANYYADYELITSSKTDAIDTKWLAFTQKHYTFPICEISNRKEVGQFVESVYGLNFRSNWEDIKGENVNMSSVIENSFIDYRINDIHNTFKHYIVSQSPFEMTNHQANILTNLALKNYLIYETLYYYETLLNYEIDLNNHFKKFAFYPQIKDKLALDSDFIDEVCKNSTEEICQTLLAGVETPENLA